MRTDYLNKALLNAAYRNTTFTSPATVYAGLLTAVSAAKVGTVTEVAYTGYARVSITFAAPVAGSGGWKIQNSGALTFVQNPGNGSQFTIVAVGIYDAASNGNLLDVVFLDGNTPLLATTTTLVSTLLHTAPGHGMAANQQVRLEKAAGQALPGAFAEDTTYFVIATGLSADQYELSASQGGGAITITSSGDYVLMRLTPVTVNVNDTPQFSVNALSLFDD